MGHMTKRSHGSDRPLRRPVGANLGRHLRVGHAGLLALLAVPLLALLAVQPSVGAQPAPLIVVGATENGLTIQSTGAELHSGITIATTDQRAKNVVARITPLLDSATGERHQVAKPRTKLATMPANSTRFLPLDAKLPYSGTFLATLSLSHDGVSDPPVPITVVRTLAISGVSVDAVQVSASTVAGLGGVAEVTRAVVLNETAGRPAVLADPVLVKPSSQTAGTMLGESGAMVTGARVVPDQEGCRAEGGLIEVDPGRSCRIEVSLALPGSPGQYEGTLRFSQPGSQPLDTGITVQMRLAPIVAIAVILLGLALGALINEVLRDRRTKLDRTAHAAQIGAELERLVAALPDGLRDPTERRTRTDLRVLLTTAASDDGDAAAVDARLDIVRAQVASFVPWVNLRRAVLEAPDPPREPLLEEVEEVGRAVVSAQLGAEDAKALPERIRGVSAKLRANQCRLVRGEIEAMRSTLPSWFSQDARTPLAEQLDRAAAFVADDTGTPELARRELGVAQQLAAASMRDRLLATLESTTPSLGMDPAGWSRLQEEVRAELAGLEGQPPERAMSAVREADRRMVLTLADAASKYVDDLLAQKQNPGSEASQAVQLKKKALEVIQGDLGTTRSKLAAGDLAGAHGALDAAHKGIREGKKAGFLGPHGTSAFVPEVPPAPPRPSDPLAPTPDLTSAGLPTPAEVARAKRINSWWLLACTLLVGLAVGMLALYAGKPTWGSLGDILLALLWGTGLWQASGALQQGFAGVRGALIR